MKLIAKMIGILMILLMPVISHAETTAWTMVPTESSISFTATQNNSPVSGKFKIFTAVIHADPQQLNSSDVQLKINMDSVSTDYSLIADTLKTADWFDVKQFPEAVFESKNFTETAKNHYQSHGTLTLRDKTLPIIVDFTVEDISPNKIKAKGTAELKRTVFGVGQGEFGKTDDVKDNVRVDFVLTAIKK